MFAEQQRAQLCEVQCQRHEGGGDYPITVVNICKLIYKYMFLYCSLSSVNKCVLLFWWRKHPHWDKSSKISFLRHGVCDGCVCFKDTFAGSRSIIFCLVNQDIILQDNYANGNLFFFFFFRIRHLAWRTKKGPNNRSSSKTLLSKWNMDNKVPDRSASALFCFKCYKKSYFRLISFHSS